jgi:hypothetical protein
MFETIARNYAINGEFCLSAAVLRAFATVGSYFRADKRRG